MEVTNEKILYKQTPYYVTEGRQHGSTVYWVMDGRTRNAVDQFPTADKAIAYLKSMKTNSAFLNGRAKAERELGMRVENKSPYEEGKKAYSEQRRYGRYTVTVRKGEPGYSEWERGFADAEKEAIRKFEEKHK